MSLKSPLGRVLGLGSAKEGTEHWWSQRVTAVAMIPLTLWFALSLLALDAYDYVTVTNWIAAPINTILLLLFAMTMLYHSKLGTQVVVEDYVHGGTKVVTLIGLKLIYAFLGVASVFSILRISLGSA
ncbi:MAG: succinate dehydrogenase, hydrophobic membrane anchor protein [Pseudomonadota bacterium]